MPETIPAVHETGSSPRATGFPPRAELRSSVLGYFAVEGASAPSVRHIVPDGSVDLLFNFAPVAGEPDAAVVGVMSEAHLAKRPAHAGLVGVAFAPGEASLFLDVPLHELRDRFVDLRDLWGTEGQRLFDALREAPSAAACAARLDASLTLHLRRRQRDAPTVRAAVHVIRERRGRIAVPQLARELGLSERRLQRLFRDRVGLSPKGYSRTVRAQTLMARLAQGPVRSWAELACDFGYADQAHLIREFRKFTGETPAGHMAALAASGGSELERRATRASGP